MNSTNILEVVSASYSVQYTKQLFFAESLADIFKAAGFEDVRYYRYWNAESSGVCVDDMLHDLENAADHSVVVLFAAGHSPTGADLSQEEWKRVAEVMMVRSQNKMMILFLIRHTSAVHLSMRIIFINNLIIA